MAAAHADDLHRHEDRDREYGIKPRRRPCMDYLYHQGKAARDTYGRTVVAFIGCARNSWWYVHTKAAHRQQGQRAKGGGQGAWEKPQQCLAAQAQCNESS